MYLCENVLEAIYYLIVFANRTVLSSNCATRDSSTSSSMTHRRMDGALYCYVYNVLMGCFVVVFVVLIVFT